MKWFDSQSAVSGSVENTNACLYFIQIHIKALLDFFQHFFRLSLWINFSRFDSIFAWCLLLLPDFFRYVFFLSIRFYHHILLWNVLSLRPHVFRTRFNVIKLKFFFGIISVVWLDRSVAWMIGGLKSRRVCWGSKK